MSWKSTAAALFAKAWMRAEDGLRHRRLVTGSAGTHVLLLEYNLPLGCCVHLTPVYEAIHATLPGVTILVATRGMGASLLRHNPRIGHLITTRDPFSQLGAAIKDLAGQLSDLKVSPDWVLTGASDQRTRITLLAMMACSGRRAGFSQTPQLLHHPLRYEAHESLIDNNLRLVPVLGGSVRRQEPVVYFSSADVSAARKLLKQANLGQRPCVVFVTQNSGGQRTGWHVDRFAAVIRQAHEVLGCEVIYVGTANEESAIQHIRSCSGGIGTSFAGRTTVTELAALLAASDAVVAVDTGTMHVARAVGVPLVVLAPSWKQPIEWLPLDLPQAIILRGEDRDTVPPGYQLDEIEAAQVIQSLEQLLITHPPKEASRTSRLERSLSEVDHLQSRQGKA